MLRQRTADVLITWLKRNCLDCLCSNQRYLISIDSHPLGMFFELTLLSHLRPVYFSLPTCCRCSLKLYIVYKRVFMNPLGKLNYFSAIFLLKILMNYFYKFNIKCFISPSHTTKAHAKYAPFFAAKRDKLK